MHEQGFRAPEAKRIAGISYRQLDYWTRTGLVTPSVNDAHGSGTQRLYSFQDLATLRVIKKLLDTGVSPAAGSQGGRVPAGDGSPAARRDAHVRRHGGLRGSLARGGRRPAAQRPGRVRDLPRRGLQRPRGHRRRGRETASPKGCGRRVVSAQPAGLDVQPLQSDTIRFAHASRAPVRAAARLLRHRVGVRAHVVRHRLRQGRPRARSGSLPTSTCRSSTSTSRSRR